MASPLSPSAVEDLRASFLEALGRVSNERDLQAVRDEYLGRKSGRIAGLMSAVAKAPPDVRPGLGRLANELKQDVEAKIAERRTSLEAARAPADAIDVTLTGRRQPAGRRHPLTLIRERMEGIFARMGFEIVDGPELEDDYHNFEALNMPADHPARDMQDTLYLSQPLGGASVLRTHTSGMQIRYMETHTPPVRIVAPGRVYRRDDLDVTHSPMFHQVEGLMVDEGVSMADLKGTLTAFVHQLFGPDTVVRFRPSFFPYTEPSAELDIGCVSCRGAGCAVCKQSGWLEILGSGMVHPALFEAVGYDPERYTGWAFGIGIERVAMLKHHIDDIRMFYENDLRLLEQFPN